MSSDNSCFISFYPNIFFLVFLHSFIIPFTDDMCSFLFSLFDLCNIIVSLPSYVFGDFLYRPLQVILVISKCYGITTLILSSPEQRSQRAIVLPSAAALVSASASTNVKVFKTSLFPNLITNLIHLWYDDTYWSKILHSTIPTTLGHDKVKVTELEFSC